MIRFNVYFNRRQYVTFYIGEEYETFKKLHNCHAWYANKTRRRKRSGAFGTIVLPRMADTPEFRGLVAHEIQHMIFDWVLCRKGGNLNTSNEERIATMTGEITRKFYAKAAKCTA